MKLKNIVVQVLEWQGVLKKDNMSVKLTEYVIYAHHCRKINSTGMYWFHKLESQRNASGIVLHNYKHSSINIDETIA